MRYTYGDGSGNKYILQNSMLVYEPISLEMSSSGTYHGGVPFTTVLEKQNLIKLIDIAERALWSEKDHTDKKTMGSGTLIKEIGQEKQRIYLKYNSESMREINSFLIGIRNNLKK